MTSLAADREDSLENQVVLGARGLTKVYRTGEVEISALRGVDLELRESELVVPILREGEVVAVIDLDAPTKGRFGAEDAAGVEALAKRIAARI